MRNERDLIKISEMAEIHGISRQTLILYDKSGLFKPAFVAENGYRYYSRDQIPVVRQICLLKSMGVPLAEIGEHLQDPTPESMIGILSRRRASLDEQMHKLAMQREELDQMTDLLGSVITQERAVGLPFVTHIGERRALYSPYPDKQMDVRQLHLALMEIWGALARAGMIPSRGFGSLFDVSALGEKNAQLRGGSIILLPHDVEVPGAQSVTIPEGDYVCMYKYAMPYDAEPVNSLLAWCADHGFEPVGEIVDCCILDGVFRNARREKDFCRLEIRVR